MPRLTVWVRLFGVEGAVIEKVEFDKATKTILATARPKKHLAGRCGRCGRRSPFYDRGEGLRMWRALDLGPVQAYIEAEAVRVQCPDHGVVVAAVPWARHGSRFTRFFEDTVAWLATQTSKTAVTELLRISWRTVGAIVRRVSIEAEEHAGLLKNLRRIGIDEISYRKGNRFIVVVVDHDTGRLVWAGPGRDRATVEKFFDLLGPDGCASIQEVSADAAAWIASAVAARCPNAKLCLDPFHVVSWATEALDEIRRAVWNEARKEGQTAKARELKGARFALWKSMKDMTSRQRGKLADIQRSNQPLYRAYLLKEQLREVFRTRGEEGVDLLKGWLSWASRCRLKPFVKVSRTIRACRKAIEETLRRGLSNGLVESTNTKIRLIARRAFGFHSAEALIALAMLDLAGLCPPLPS